MICDCRLVTGTSTGANVIAAPRLAAEPGPDVNIVTVICDTGLKYLRSANRHRSPGRTGDLIMAPVRRTCGLVYP